MTAGALVLYFRGATLNTMVLAGFLVALALVIDDAVVNVDNTMRRLSERGPSLESRPERGRGLPVGMDGGIG
jgi:multidrug efflux pump subunit AcrB